MVSVYYYLLSAQYVVKRPNGLDNAQQLLLPYEILCLSLIQFPGLKGQGAVILHDHTSQLVVNCICIDVEFLSKVKIG